MFVTVALTVLWKEASGNWRAVPLVTKQMLSSGYFCLHPACSFLYIFHLQHSAESALTRSTESCLLVARHSGLSDASALNTIG